MAKKSRKDEHEEAERWMYGMVGSYGLDCEFLTKPQAFGILGRLKRGERPADVAKAVNLSGFQVVGPSKGQIGFMKAKDLPWDRPRCKREAGLILDAFLKPLKVYKRLIKEIDKAKSDWELDAVKRDLAMVLDVLPQNYRPALFEAGSAKRQEIEAKKNGEAF